MEKKRQLLSIFFCLLTLAQILVLQASTRGSAHEQTLDEHTQSPQAASHMLLRSTQEPNLSNNLRRFDTKDISSCVGQPQSQCVKRKT